MKATVIKFYDEQGNEIKNVSTEIVLNGETYVKKEADKQPDYSHLVGMWCEFISELTRRFSPNKWYKCDGIDKDGAPFFLDNNNQPASYTIGMTPYTFDLTNPKPYNPDTVVGLKELPNDGKTYAEAIRDVSGNGETHAYNGLFYKVADGFIEGESGLIKCVLWGNQFLKHTPAKPIWETCREGMWEYDETIAIESVYENSNSLIDKSLTQLTKHLNALAYLSEVARRNNGDRVLDWTDGDQNKYYVRRYKNTLEAGCSPWYHKEIIFLDREARDHSFEVDKHIWNDYYNLPNE